MIIYKTIAYQIIIFLVFGCLICGNAYGQDVWFVSNTAGGADNGSQSDPWDTITDALTNMEDGDTVYIHASGTPYRELFSNQNMYASTFYCDWVGTGSTRGTAKALVYGSADFSGATWSNVSGSIYKTAYDAAAASSELEDRVAGDEAVWFVDGTTITPLAGSDPYNSTVGADEFFYDTAADELYINIGEDPTGSQIEVLVRAKCIEVWKHSKIYNGVFRYGLYGNHNFSCYCWDFDGCEFSYNTKDGFYTLAQGTLECPATVLNRVSVHNNGENGIHLDGTTSNTHITDSVVHDNNGIGIYLGGANNVGVSPGPLRVLHSVVYNNAGWGIYVKRYLGLSITAEIYNTISVNNLIDFFAESHADVSLQADYNCGSTYGGKWSAGDNDIDADPLFRDAAAFNFRLQRDSPCRDVGLATGPADDYYGKRRPKGYGVDIGAAELLGPINCNIN